MRYLIKMTLSVLMYNARASLDYYSYVQSAVDRIVRAIEIKMYIFISYIFLSYHIRASHYSFVTFHVKFPRFKEVGNRVNVRSPRIKGKNKEDSDTRNLTFPNVNTLYYY